MSKNTIFYTSLCLRPFSDGNGRVGRLIANHILGLLNYQPMIVIAQKKDEYYRALQNRSLQQFLLFMLTGYIEEYKKR